MSFNNLQLARPLLRAVADAGYTTPSPIQKKAIPQVLLGQDLLACAQTGTGKTAAFALPILQLLSGETSQSKRPIRALVLTPTRELALQIKENFDIYSKNTRLKTAVIFGGVSQGPQVTQLHKGIDILVATPGRLNDLINQGHINLSKTEIFVLDEADRMLDMGFIHDVRKVISKMPAKRQNLLFSATMPKEIMTLANSILQNPAKVFVAPAATTVEAIAQSVYHVDKKNKRLLLCHLLKETSGSALVFTRTKHGADRVVRELRRANILAMAIHGDKSQNARQNALAQFKEGKTKVLVATDIAARGIDISELPFVFNYDLPNISETYVHRIGRTGRAGQKGSAISFCSCEELEFLDDIQKLINIKIPVIESHPFPAQETLQDALARAAENKANNKPRQRKQNNNTRKNAQEKPTQKNKKIEEKTFTKQKKNQIIQTNGGQTMQKNKFNRKPNNLLQDPYKNLTGGKAIVTRRPVWGDEPQTEPENLQDKGDTSMSRNSSSGGNNRRNTSKPRVANVQNNVYTQKKSFTEKPKPEKIMPEIKKTTHGVFDFSERELSEDSSIKIISRTNSETKYANFEDFLKDH